jgi:hypothetical protein
VSSCLSCEQDTSGEYLCHLCGARLGRQLTDLPPLYAALGAYLRPSTQARTAVGSGCPGPHAPLPVSLEALDLVGPGSMVTVLETWRQALHEDAEIRVVAPWGDYPGRLRRAVNGLYGRLWYIRRDWPQAGLFAAEVSALHAAARSVVAPPVKTVRAGLCPKKLDDGTTCGAVLRAEPGVPEIHCRWCGTDWPPSAWLKLAASTAA